MRWPLALAGSGALFLLVGVSTVRESYREWKVDQEIRQMQTEIERLEGKKLSLAELIARLDSPEAVDKEARTRLGLRKPGERVVILRGLEGAQPWEAELGDVGLPVAATVSVDTRSNPRKWLDYFFKPTN